MYRMMIMMSTISCRDIGIEIHQKPKRIWPFYTRFSNDTDVCQTSGHEGNPSSHRLSIDFDLMIQHGRVFLFRQRLFQAPEPHLSHDVGTGEKLFRHVGTRSGEKELA